MFDKPPFERVEWMRLDRVEVRSDGRTVQREVVACWDGKPGGDIRVLVHINDGGWRANVPLTNSFIKSPDNAPEESP